ncbi:glycosyltransferase [Acetivibrio ethanolgignens]|uniref:Glycosyl transferase family 1 domain-containing protein n=1 Tax=Acetivibrio ethanolgignens TaxID=290052 RepID=A0A0V8QAE5_9FIRM|nr:glycosyltransferase [Acetivibrio ethanolgignens]KSV57498.1 hypothetical protein ASU35_04795 [Acetivibrio ethanolgignens]
MLKTLVLLPGSIDNIFLKNEMEYLKRNFNIIYIFVYENPKKDWYVKEKKIKTLYVKNFTVKSIIKSFFNFLLIKELRQEVIKQKNLKKILYAFFYENFYCNVCQIIKKVQLEGEVYLYSFWLSRGAYAVARYKRENANKVKKAVSRAHGYDLYEERNKLKYLPFRNFIRENLDEIYFISKHGKNYFLNRYGKADCQYEISRLGTNNEKRIEKIIRNKKEICIASCSSIISVKRLDLLIRILKELKVPYRWIHIGNGKLREEIETYAGKVLPKNSYLFLGKIENDKVLEIYKEYDVDFFINTSDSEGIPVSIMEAMSAGIPVICRNVGGNGEIVNGENGLLLEEKEEDIVINRMEEFLKIRLEKREEYRKKSIACIQSWNERYNAEKNYEEFCKKMRE